MSKSLWTILVPTKHADTNKLIRVRFHRVWDEKVREITGGLTILHPAKGQWISPSGELFAEHMIPVQIMCTKKQIEQIAQMTGKYYKQLAILYYKITDEVIIKNVNL